MAPDAKKIEELVARIVNAVHPLHIYLFGSTARGDMRPSSDLDVLVVMRDGVHRGRITDLTYRNMLGFGMAKDFIVVTERDVETHRANPYVIVKTALDEGREIYRSENHKCISANRVQSG